MKSWDLKAGPCSRRKRHIGSKDPEVASTQRLRKDPQLARVT